MTGGERDGTHRGSQASRPSGEPLGSRWGGEPGGGGLSEIPKEN